jgi:hypothetical protein
MTRICWGLIDKVSRILDPNERDAVLGDFAETDKTGGEALLDLVGLVVRRQIGYWKEWQPWVALLGVVAPMGVLVGLACRWWAEGSADILYLYVNGWTSAYLESPGGRLDLAHNLEGILFAYLALVCWSWTSGFVIGSLSRRTVGVNGALFAFLLFGEALLIPQHHNPYDPLVWSLTFYSVVYPLLLRAVLILVPVLWGMRKALRLATVPPLQTILAGVAIAFITGLAAQPLAFSVMGGWLHLHAAWQLRLVPLVVVWPTVFMVATAKWLRRTLQVLGCALILSIVTVVPVVAHSYRLPMGKYGLTVERQDFKEAVRENIPVGIGGTKAVNFFLESRIPHNR